MLENGFSSKNNVLLHAPAVAERRDTKPQEQAMRSPKPIPGQHAKPPFTVYAYSEQAREIVAAMIAGATVVVAVSLDGAGR
jgi:hypothetical protein